MGDVTSELALTTRPQDMEGADDVADEDAEEGDSDPPSSDSEGEAED